MKRTHYLILAWILTVLILSSFLIYCIASYKKIRKVMKPVQVVRNLNSNDTESLPLDSSEASESFSLEEEQEVILPTDHEIASNIDPSTKIVLIWTEHDPFNTLLDQQAFFNRNCKVKHCYVTRNKEYKRNISLFDVVLFDGPDVIDKKLELPHSRSTKQKYVIVSNQSSEYHPVCDNRFDNYFNMSWTYKINSETYFGHFIIRNKKGEVIGPKKEMTWLHVNDMKPIDNVLKQKLSSKKKLAAWYSSNCNVPNGGENYIKEVQKELETLNNSMSLDIYGSCGSNCGKNCLSMLEKDYYFYFSFENSFEEDFFTEQLLFPLQNHIVPVVYGGARYDRFMPIGTYLNAMETEPAILAQQMVDIATSKRKYYNLFKWINHYSYHKLEESPETDMYCKFCEKINDVAFMKKSTKIEDFRRWWSPLLSKKACLKNKAGKP